MNGKKIEILERNFNLYWSGQEPEISDQRFDELLEELRMNEPNHPLLTKLGLDVERGQEYVHTTPMLSLDKVYCFADLKKWIGKVARTPEEKFVVQYKFDGLAGKLVDQTLATRGNGKVGENISRRRADIRLIQGCKITPMVKIKRTDDPVIGEIVVTQNDFWKYKDTLGRDFAHPRNFVAGMVNRKDPLPPGVKLDFVEYKSSPSVWMQAKEFTEENWNRVVENFSVQKTYPTDGLVVKLEDEPYAESLGCTGHHPLGSIAFKFYGETGLTILLDVEWSHGKGCLTPVALVRPFEIGGVTISRVTMHNAKFVKDKDIQIGDTLEIERAGEVIPHVLIRKPGENRKSCIPNNCPTCGAPLEYREPELVCTNPECSGTAFEKLRCSLECFEIDGLGVTVMEHLVKLNLVHSPVDIFRLTYEEALRIPGFADGLANKLIKNIVSARRMTPETILASLNTPGVGKSMYAKILENIPFEELISGVDFTRLAGLPNIGETRAKAIKRSLHASKQYLQDLLSIVEVQKTVKQEGKKVCFTGKMDKPRSYYQQQAKERGFVPVDNVTKDLDLLVISSRDWTSNKTKTADKLGIKTITLEEWENE